MRIVILNRLKPVKDLTTAFVGKTVDRDTGHSHPVKASHGRRSSTDEKKTADGPKLPPCCNLQRHGGKADCQ
jgi:hypothetical protein